MPRPRIGRSILTFPSRDQFPDRACDLFYRRVGIDSVLVEQVDRVDSEARQGGVGGLPDELGPTLESGPSVRVDFPELGGHDDLMTNGGKRVPHELLVRERAVDLRGVKERHAQVHRVPDQRDRLVPRREWRCGDNFRPMQPSPSADTSGPPVPSVLFPKA